ncbi:HNH endonuclease [Mesorhizobium sp. M0130]|uniref:HNH endonuclease n=1 Tax=Mesorhizobium sp. M0130 TaxID=2956887 RepID=UPI003336C89B
MKPPRISDPHGGRSLSEWIGSTPDAKVPDWVRDRIFVRAGRRCHISGRRIRPGEGWQLEHIKPLSLGGEHRESNLAPALNLYHQAKSSIETDLRAKADRQRRKNDGTWPKPVRPLQSRGFPKQHEEQR